MIQRASVPRLTAMPARKRALHPVERRAVNVLADSGSGDHRGTRVAARQRLCCRSQLPLTVFKLLVNLALAKLLIVRRNAHIFPGCRELFHSNEVRCLFIIPASVVRRTKPKLRVSTESAQRIKC